MVFFSLTVGEKGKVKMASGLGKGGGAHAIKGLRLLTMERGADGFGFHMYTNRERDGQYVKSVSPNSSADLAGMFAGDHIVGVDGENVISLSHHQVSGRQSERSPFLCARLLCAC